jgi:hypothetical protein
VREGEVDRHNHRKKDQECERVEKHSWRVASNLIKPRAEL